MDRDAGKGFTTSVGWVRKANSKNNSSVFKFLIVSHNTQMGAALGNILNAELAYKLGYLN